MSVVALRSWPLARAATLAVIAVGATACSSEATRFGNPFSTQATQHETTGSIQQQRASAGSVQTAALPPPGGSQPSTSGVSGGGRGMGSYQPNQSADPAVTGTVPSQPSSNRPPPATPKTAAKAGQHGVHVVAPGETLYRISRQYSVPVAELARYNNIPAHTKLNIGDQIKIPGNRTARLPQPETSKVAQPKSLNAPAKAKAEPKTLPKSQPQAAAPPTESAALASPAPAAEPETTNAVRKGNAGLQFRWPAKGRIIAGFGPKTNGQTNDGINIAVPEGTPVKAAADGTVAYAGNELKGYGNLVLVRHADGYVTAYAHAKELLVRRGDTVRRGQDIARSGQTGNVDTPQLHFEIRKGPAPIDPMPLLNGGG